MAIIKDRTGLKLVVSLLLMLTWLAPAQSYADEYTAVELEKTVQGILEWRQQAPTEANGQKNDIVFSSSDLENAGQTATDWFAFATGRFGSQANYEDYQSMLSKSVVERYQNKEKLSRNKATEWHRIGLSLLAIGGDPEYVSFTGEASTVINLVQDGTYDRGKATALDRQGSNGLIWALLLLDSLNYEVPVDAHTTRQELIRDILAIQRTDGGFPLANDESNIDITGMALAALAPYYNSVEEHTFTSTASGDETTKTVRQAIDESLCYVSKEQLKSGGFATSGVENPESTVQVLVGLTSLGIDPLTDRRFIKNGKTLIDQIMMFQQPDGGFIHSFEKDPENSSADPNKSNNMASEQVAYGLTAVIRQQKGMRHLYDMRAELTKERKNSLKQVIQAIDDLDQGKTASKTEVSALYQKYLALPLEDRQYVSNYGLLQPIVEKYSLSLADDTYTSLNTGKAEKGNGNVTSVGTGLAMQQGSQWELTDADIETYQGLEKPIALSQRATVLALLQKYSNQASKGNYQTEIDKLTNYEKELTSQLKELERLNHAIQTTLYPFEDLTFTDYPKIKKMMTQAKDFSKEDRSLIIGYDDLTKSYVQTGNLLRSVLIAVVAVFIVISGTVILVMRQRKRKRQKHEAYFIVVDDDEENDE